MMRMVRFSFILGMTCIVSACQIALPGVGSGTRKAPQSLRLAQTDLVITAPDGYCIDPSSASQENAAHFVALAACKSLRDNALSESKTLLITLTFTPQLEAPDEITVASLDAYFQSEGGRTMLARSGSADDVQLLSSDVEDSEIYLFHATDISPDQVAGLATDYWRAITVVQGRLLSVSAVQFDATPTPEPTAKQLVVQLARDVRAQNASLDAQTATEDIF